MGYAEVSELTGIPVYTLKDYRAKGDKGPRSAVIAGKSSISALTFSPGLMNSLRTPARVGLLRLCRDLPR
jgi:hypothetical protein